jgi:hypothetical protein
VVNDNVFERAASVIDTGGWVKEDYGSLDRGFCAVGALRQAKLGTIHAGSEDLIAEQIHLADVIEPGWRERWRNSYEGAMDVGQRMWSRRAHRVVTEWNDHVDRTKNEVVEALRKAAAA